jgi:hypothetical protein
MHASQTIVLRTGIGQHVTQPVGRVVGIEDDVEPAGLEHRQHRHHRVAAVGEEQRDRDRGIACS